MEDGTGMLVAVAAVGVGGYDAIVATMSLGIVPWGIVFGIAGFALMRSAGHAIVRAFAPVE